MSKTKKWIIVGIVALLLLFFLMFFVKTGFLSKKSAQTSIDEVIENVFEGIDSENPFSEAIKENTTIKIRSVRLGWFKYNCICTVTAPDLAGCLEKCIEDAQNEGNPTAKYLEITEKLKAQSKKADVLEQEFTITFEKNGSKLEPILTEKLLAFLGGNMQDVLIDNLH